MDRHPIAPTTIQPRTTATSGDGSGAAGPAGAAATITIGAVTTGAPGSAAAVTNVGSASSAIFDFALPRGATGLKGDTGNQGIQGIKGDTGDQGIQGLKGDTGNQGIQGLKGDTGSQGIQGIKGDTGAASTVAGPQGNPGTAATVTVGTVTTGAAGSAAQITNGGTSSAASFNFTIPRGDQGIQGIKGDTGAASTVPGPQGNPGAAATITVGTVTTGAAGSAVQVTNGGTTSAAVLNFTIPKGDTGAAGSGGGSTDVVATSFRETGTVLSRFEGSGGAAAAGSTGVGIEIVGRSGLIQAFNRTTSALVPAIFRGSSAALEGTGVSAVLDSTGLTVTAPRILVGGNILTSGATGVIGYASGSGGAVTQATSRTTGVILNKGTGAITLFSKATTAGLVDSFVVTNSLIVVGDTINLAVKATGVYLAFVTDVNAGSFRVSIHTPAAQTAAAPVVYFTVVKGATS